MKKVVAVLGSPRADGNSAAIADRILETARGLGAQTQRFVLNELTYKGCQACLACKKTAEKCVVEDDLAQVLEAIGEADVLVVASPIYFGQITGQLKCFIDRMYSFLEPDYITNPTPGRFAPGKQWISVSTQANPDETLFDAFAGYERFLKRMGFECHAVRGVGIGAKGDAAANAELMRKAEETAKLVLSC